MSRVSSYHVHESAEFVARVVGACLHVGVRALVCRVRRGGAACAGRCHLLEQPRRSRAAGVLEWRSGSDPRPVLTHPNTGHGRKKI